MQGVSRRSCLDKLLHTAPLHKGFYTQTLWHEKRGARERFCAERLCTEKRFGNALRMKASFYTRTQWVLRFFLLCRHFYTLSFCGSCFFRAFAHRSVCVRAKTFSYRHCHTQTLWRTTSCAHRCFFAQKGFHTEMSLHIRPLHTDDFEHKKSWHTGTFTQRRSCVFYFTPHFHSRCSTQNLAHTHAQNKCANFVMRKLPSCFYAQISKQRCVRKEYQNDHRATRRAIRQAFPVWELLEPTQWHTSIERLARISCVRFGPAASKVTSRLVISPDCVSYRSSYFSLGRRLTFVCGRFLKTVAAALSQAVSLLALGCRCPRWSCK